MKRRVIVTIFKKIVMVVMSIGIGMIFILKIIQREIQPPLWLLEKKMVK